MAVRAQGMLGAVSEDAAAWPGPLPVSKEVDVDFRKFCQNSFFLEERVNFCHKVDEKDFCKGGVKEG